MRIGNLGFIEEKETSAVATAQRLQRSDSGAFADWMASSSSSAGDLSLGFNADTAPAATNCVSAGGGMWSPAVPAARQTNGGLTSEIFFVPPATSCFHSHVPETMPSTAAINFDTHPFGVGVIPILTATPYPLGGDEDGLSATARGRINGGGMHLWHPQHQQGNNNNNSPAPDYLKKAIISSAADHANLLIGGRTPFTATTSCQDCGNQAKKDCSQGRCRTCCRTRGFSCATHVKSTWVPVSRRRERQHTGCLDPTATTAAGSSQSTSGGAGKKPRLRCGGASQTTSHTSTSNNATTPRSFETSSSHQGFKDSLPGQVNVPTVFKCVRVMSVDDGGEDQYAYQAVVQIKGRVFKGFLYDQGVEAKESLIPNKSYLHLGGVDASRKGPPSSHQVAEAAHDMCGGTLIGGSSYGNSIN